MRAGSAHLEDVVEDGVAELSSAFWSNSRPWMMRICLRKVDPCCPCPRPAAGSDEAPHGAAAGQPRVDVPAAPPRLAPRVAGPAAARPALGQGPAGSAGSRQRLRVRTGCRTWPLRPWTPRRARRQPAAPQAASAAAAAPRPALACCSARRGADDAARGPGIGLAAVRPDGRA